VLTISSFLLTIGGWHAPIDVSSSTPATDELFGRVASACAISPAVMAAGGSPTLF
jgi:hypothetical protein